MDIWKELRDEGVDSGLLEEVQRFREAHPLAPEALLSTPCDILAPCGLGGVLTSQSVSQLRCAAVAGAANNQLERPSAHGLIWFSTWLLSMGIAPSSR